MTPAVSACSGELASGSDAEMMDAKAGREDEKHTKRCGWKGERESQETKCIKCFFLGGGKER